MNTLQKEDVVQAVLIADTYERTLQPFVKLGSTVGIESCLHAGDAMCHRIKAIESNEFFNISIEFIAAGEYTYDRLCTWSIESVKSWRSLYICDTLCWRYQKACEVSASIAFISRHIPFLKSKLGLFYEFQTTHWRIMYLVNSNGRTSRWIRWMP